MENIKVNNLKPYCGTCAYVFVIPQEMEWHVFYHSRLEIEKPSKRGGRVTDIKAGDWARWNGKPVIVIQVSDDKAEVTVWVDTKELNWVPKQ